LVTKFALITTLGLQGLCLYCVLGHHFGLEHVTELLLLIQEPIRTLNLALEVIASALDGLHEVQVIVLIYTGPEDAWL